jgi:hypothetical protein
MKMTTRSAILALALALPGAARATDRSWDGADVGLQLAFLAVSTVDVLQTVTNIAPGCHEINPIFGTKCPSTGHVLATAAFFQLAHLYVSHALPHGRWRTAWQSVTLTVEIGVVGRNHLIGYRIKF